MHELETVFLRAAANYFNGPIFGYRLSKYKVTIACRDIKSIGLCVKTGQDSFEVSIAPRAFTEYSWRFAAMSLVHELFHVVLWDVEEDGGHGMPWRHAMMFVGLETKAGNGWEEEAEEFYEVAELGWQFTKAADLFMSWWERTGLAQAERALFRGRLIETPQTPTPPRSYDDEITVDDSDFVAEVVAPVAGWSAAILIGSVGMLFILAAMTH